MKVNIESGKVFLPSLSYYVRDLSLPHALHLLRQRLPSRAFYYIFKHDTDLLLVEKYLRVFLFVKTDGEVDIRLQLQERAYLRLVAHSDPHAELLKSSRLLDYSFHRVVTKKWLSRKFILSLVTAALRQLNVLEAIRKKLGAEIEEVLPAFLSSSDQAHGGSSSSEDHVSPYNAYPDSQSGSQTESRSNTSESGNSYSEKDLDRELKQLLNQYEENERRRRSQKLRVFLRQAFQSDLTTGVYTGVSFSDELRTDTRKIADLIIQIASKIRSRYGAADEIMRRKFNAPAVAWKLQLGLDIRPEFEARRVPISETAPALILSPDYSGSTQAFSADVGTLVLRVYQRALSLGYETFWIPNYNGEFIFEDAIIASETDAWRRIQAQELREDDLVFYFGDEDPWYKTKEERWGPAWVIGLSIYSCNWGGPRYVKKEVKKVVWVDRVRLLEPADIIQGLKVAYRYLR